MINGTHLLIYSTNPDADRAFFRDVLKFRSVDAGGGWLIFGLPPAELGVHPSEGTFVQRHAGEDLIGTVLYLMCTDIQAEVRTLQAQKVVCSPIDKAPWGLFTIFQLPSGGKMGLYQPSHPTAIETRPAGANEHRE